MTAYIGLGSNLADPVSQVQLACSELKQLPESHVLACSSLYRSPPMGPADQPDYINAVAAIETTLTPHQLLAELQAIEQRHGRKRERRWGARTLDLDLLIYAEMALSDERLTLPHPGLAERDFVLYPLQEIAPSLVVPGLGALDLLVGNCPSKGLSRYE
ncbi:2-amino-4-hydroxy-6-hydroxymethyldihydropteridine diphosphokinase [Sedimenticola selenatireducens]|uniref:2-amino-4-hydroxy-6- hydroxymethyldihydropteridine diphosphokinase n=1 Tax=Sedimenticola selenatireducens TaxID=191960 RepID=UPI0021B3E8E5|nr:2-amino-4-hydroxy-6-hydroxymethyldihydropteridine diphosphokinase [Sedimenticola selenatireducens]